MPIQQKTTWGKLTLLMLVVALSLACNILTPQNSNVQDVVPAVQEPIDWQLSPPADKLLYTTDSQRGQAHRQAVMQVLATNQEITIPGCLRSRWLDTVIRLNNITITLRLTPPQLMTLCLEQIM